MMSRVGKLVCEGLIMYYAMLRNEKRNDTTRQGTRYQNHKSEASVHIRSATMVV